TEFYYADVFYSEGAWQIGTSDKFHSLAYTLQEHYNSYFFINIVDADSQQMGSLIKLMNNGEKWKKIVFTASNDNTIVNLRKISPQWTYANSTIFLLKFMMFSSLKLESMMDIPTDILFIKSTPHYFMNYQSAFMNEARRQNKLIFIGPVSGPLEEFDSTHWLMNQTE
ncbi:MAG: hypothetical protein HRT44_04790, partial [Bdellovibrionales bacterium]|nr:hypothetical protein [Bdellovibrionales bacterium]NQZ18560.1 hypothetical protein [Bdellovibrionales bacterium]